MKNGQNICRQIDTHCDRQGTGGKTQDTIVEHCREHEDIEDVAKVVMVTVVDIITGWLLAGRPRYRAKQATTI